LPPIGPDIWGDAQVMLPCGCRERYQNVLTGAVLDVETQISVSSVLADCPVALCVRI